MSRYAVPFFIYFGVALRYGFRLCRAGEQYQYWCYLLCENTTSGTRVCLLGPTTTMPSYSKLRNRRMTHAASCAQPCCT